MCVSYIGRSKSINKLLRYLKQGGEPKILEIKEIIKDMVGNFAVVIENDNWLFALVDRISGYQLFYRDTDTGCILSNSPRILVNNDQEQLIFNENSILEINMAGYLTGNRTINKNIYQLCAGKMLLCNKKLEKYTVSTYFKFYSQNIKKKSNNELIEELDGITNVIIKRNIEDAAGRTIWVPLSGGLDSRLIICKLKQLGCRNLRAYSYGVPGNFDALRANKIASHLDISWEFMPTTKVEAEKYFLSKDRKKYWDFADGLSVVPNLHGMFALKGLVNSGKMKLGDVVINGQSGDFIAGQHIPVLDKQEINNDLLLSQILKKNYSLRRDMFNDSNSIQLMKTKIRNSLGAYQHVTSYQEFAKSYEYWGWKERQVKRVVNGQRNYDYLGLNWELPLWDLEYMQFWVDMPIEQKINRNLFVEYLNKMNFYGLFKDSNKFMSRWPINRIYIQFFGNILSKIFGKNISDMYYKRLDWYSQYQYIYALIGKHEYNLHWREYRGAYPYMTNVWLNENIKGNK
jgi:asparagine synthase (glutamine-hydrolysing)